MRTDENATAFVELERAIHELAVSLISNGGADACAEKADCVYGAGQGDTRVRGELDPVVAAPETCVPTKS